MIELLALLLSSQLPNCQSAVNAVIQPFTTFPKDTEFIIYVNVSTHHDQSQYQASLLVGIPGQTGYRCQFLTDKNGNAFLVYVFKSGEIKLNDEFFACVTNLENSKLNCDVHRYVTWKNPEIINIRLRY